MPTTWRLFNGASAIAMMDSCARAKAGSRRRRTRPAQPARRADRTAAVGAGGCGACRMEGGQVQASAQHILQLRGRDRIGAGDGQHSSPHRAQRVAGQWLALAIHLSSRRPLSRRAPTPADAHRPPSPEGDLRQRSSSAVAEDSLIDPMPGGRCPRRRLA